MNKTRVVMYLSIFILLFSLYNILEFFYDRFQTKQLYSSVQEEFVTSNRVNDLPLVKGISRGKTGVALMNHYGITAPTEEDPIINEKFLPLIERNTDTVGWISVPNTDIDYPVVKTDNNHFYLEHDFDKEPSRAGSIFMDYRNDGDTSDRHTIIYGHNMRDGTMFQQLAYYKEEDFFHDNLTITFHSLYDETEWEIFSAYVTTTDFYYIVTSFRSNRDYMDFLHELMGKSAFSTDVELTEHDQILTLSTCTYEFNDARYVVHARKIK
ncbi:class B sortase [Evansella tamaricis]|uniref:Class B sortase n=1 Tax=Evansella tamaricis TaxID=2069301 RepID=A0ABS6JDH9_9BACI|nr:class B sortase [Evansella tamaricis]MBU9711724.1 class B sortase [Evansella tamaricis]